MKHSKKKIKSNEFHFEKLLGHEKSKRFVQKNVKRGCLDIFQILLKKQVKFY